MFIEVPGDSLPFAREAGGHASEDLELALLTVDETGHRKNGKEATVNLRRPASDLNPRAQPDIRWLVPVVLNPGRYQVRVAAHDVRTNRTGSVFVDLEVPRRDTRPAIGTLVMTDASDGGPIMAGDWTVFSQLPQPPTTRREFTQGEAVHIAAKIWVPKGTVMPKEATVRLRNVMAPAAPVIEYHAALQAAASGGVSEMVAKLPTEACGRFEVTVEIAGPGGNASQAISRGTTFQIAAR
jgi:hypothetical protein